VFEYSVARKKFLARFEGQYDEEFSVTDLMQAPKQLWLKRKFRDDIVIDLVRDNYHALLGSVVHSILEKYAPPEAIVEERQHTILNIDGVRVLIHGQPDYYDPSTGDLIDYKFTSGFAVLYDKKEYEFQLNVNAWLFRNRGLKPESLRNIYLFRSLDKQAQARNPEYPKQNIMPKGFTPWTHQETEKKIRFYAKRLLAHKDTPWKKLPDCTNEERWIRDTKFAVMKRKVGTKAKPIQDWGKNAHASFDTKKEAIKYVADTEFKEEVKIVERSGPARKCEDFCPVVAWCGQRQAELKAKQKRILQG
jgi:hypothetical protein